MTRLATVSQAVPAVDKASGSDRRKAGVARDKEEQNRIFAGRDRPVPAVSTTHPRLPGLRPDQAGHAARPAPARSTAPAMRRAKARVPAAAGCARRCNGSDLRAEIAALMGPATSAPVQVP